jgi:hypothetical protein
MTCNFSANERGCIGAGRRALPPPEMSTNKRSSSDVSDIARSFILDAAIREFSSGRLFLAPSYT